MVTVKPAIIPGKASGTSTLYIICQGLPPIDSAASTRLLSTSLTAASTKRANSGVMAIVKGTIAAVVPTVVPTIHRVSGIIDTMRIIKGVDRTKLTTNPKPLCSEGLSKICRRSVTTNSIPNGSPNTTASKADTRTICSVCCNDTNTIETKAGEIHASSHIAYYLRMQLLSREPI